MGNTNRGLTAAGRNKKDEFYTQMQDILEELQHYKEHFRGKTVLCNCDDPYESNFFKYFASNFNILGLRRLICTCYNGSTAAGREVGVEPGLFTPEQLGEAGLQATQSGPPLDQEGKPHIAHYLEMNSLEDWDGDGGRGLADVRWLIEHNPGTIHHPLKGNGDFRSDECRKFLKEADIVVTNPPFSLFREFMQLLIDENKKFLVIGHMNNVTYKEFFPHIRDGRVWLGYGFKGGAGFFHSAYDDVATAGQHKPGMIRVSGVTWFTNLDIKKRHEPLNLFCEYAPERYPKYDNFDAIEVSKSKDIPADWDGLMGVPVTFLEKYCPEQFEILGLDRYYVPQEALVGGRVAINGKGCYARMIIRKRKDFNHED